MAEFTPLDGVEGGSVFDRADERFDAAEERLRLGHKQRGRSEQVADRHEALAAELGWTRAAARAQARRLPDSYWLAEPPEWQLANARQIAAASHQGVNREQPLLSATLPDGSRHAGRGVLEQLMIGPHAPSGFREIYDLAR